MAAHIDYFKKEDGYVFVSTLRYLTVDAPDGTYNLMPGVDVIVGAELKKKIPNSRASRYFWKN